MSIFEAPDAIARKRKKKLKKLKKKKYLEFLKRTHIIFEAVKTHEKNRKKAKETLAKGGWGESPSMEELDFAFAAGASATKAIVMAGNTLAKLKARQKGLTKSKRTHLGKLKKARKKMKGRTRT